MAVGVARNLREGPSGAIVSAEDVVPLVKGGAIPNGVRALLVGVAGTLNITTVKGAKRDAVPFQVGVTPIQIIELRTGGSALDVWALV